MVFANAEALLDFERHWALTVLRWYSQVGSEEAQAQALLMNEDTGEMITVLDVIALIEAGFAENGDIVQVEQADTAV